MLKARGMGASFYRWWGREGRGGWGEGEEEPGLEPQPLRLLGRKGMAGLDWRGRRQATLIPSPTGATTLPLP